MESTKPRFIEERLTAIEDKLDRLLIAIGEGEQRMTVRDIAEMKGISRQTLYTTKRYLLPDFGEGLDKGRKYTRAEVINWLAKGEAQLYKDWKSSERDKK